MITSDVTRASSKWWVADGLQQMERGLQQFTILKVGEHAWTYQQVHLTPHWNYKPPTTTINCWNNPISIVCAPSPIRQFDQKATTFEITAPFENSTFQCWKNANTMLERYPSTLVHNLKGHSLRWLMFTILDFPMFFLDVIQAILIDLWKRYQVCREVDSPGQSGSGNQDLGPLKNIESAMMIYTVV